MTRTPKRYANVQSKNSQMTKSDYEKLETIKKRGFADGSTDPQPCELAPVNLTKQEEIEAWTSGYRAAWVERKVKNAG